MPKETEEALGKTCEEIGKTWSGIANRKISDL